MGSVTDRSDQVRYLKNSTKPGPNTSIVSCTIKIMHSSHNSIANPDTTSATKAHARSVALRTA